MSEKTDPPPNAAQHVLLAWLIPGAGLWKQGLKSRAILVFGLLQMTFLLGCIFRGNIVLPDLNSGADGFNIVAVLVFLISMGNGGLGALSLLGSLTGGSVALLPINEAHDYADLGQMYLLVSGGLNYFLVMALLSPELMTRGVPASNSDQSPDALGPDRSDSTAGAKQ